MNTVEPQCGPYRMMRSSGARSLRSATSLIAMVRARAAEMAAAAADSEPRFSAVKNATTPSRRATDPLGADRHPPQAQPRLANLHPHQRCRSFGNVEMPRSGRRYANSPGAPRHLDGPLLPPVSFERGRHVQPTEAAPR